MAPPVIISALFDKSPANYAPGDQVNLTVEYKPGTQPSGSQEVFAVHTSAVDALSRSGNLDITFTTTDGVEIPVPTTVTVSDDGNHSWTKVSDDGGTAVFRTTA